MARPHPRRIPHLLKARSWRCVLGATSLFFHPSDAILGSHSRPARCKFEKTRGWVIRSAINFEVSQRGPQSANVLRIFSCNQPPSGSGGVVRQNGASMRSLFILVAICFSGTVFAQSAPPKVGNKALIQVKPKAPTGCKFVGTVRGTKLWAGDCAGPELRGSTTTTENQALPEEPTGSITPDPKE